MKKTVNSIQRDVSVSKLISFATEQFHRHCDSIRNDYDAGARDCSNGIYDKFYRYNRDDDGHAYDAGWYDANQVVQNETVTFI